MRGETTVFIPINITPGSALLLTKYIFGKLQCLIGKLYEYTGCKMVKWYYRGLKMILPTLKRKFRSVVKL